MCVLGYTGMNNTSHAHITVACMLRCLHQQEQQTVQVLRSQLKLCCTANIKLCCTANIKLCCTANIKLCCTANIKHSVLRWAQWVCMQGGSEVIKIGDNVVPYHPDFRFYMTSKLANPHYPPEVSVKVSLLNFFVTPEGLEEQLLDTTVIQVRQTLPVYTCSCVTQLHDVSVHLSVMSSLSYACLVTLFFLHSGNHIA